MTCTDSILKELRLQVKICKKNVTTCTYKPQLTHLTTTNHIAEGLEQGPISTNGRCILDKDVRLQKKLARI